MAIVTIWQGIEAGKFVIKLYSDGLSSSNSVNLKFSYTASQLTLKEILFSGSSSTSMSGTVIGSLGNAEVSGQFTGGGSGQPFATLVFSGSGSGTFNLDFSSLRLNGITSTFVDPPAYAFAITNTPDTSNIVLNEDSSYTGTYNPFSGLFASKLELAVQPKHGTVSFAGNALTQSYSYKPDANYFGQDTFSIRARDGLDEKIIAVSASINAVNDEPVGTVTVIGEKTVGYKIIASNNLSDADGMGVVQYTWQKSSNSVSWSDIAGANSSNLDLVSDLAGQNVRVVASYKDLAGTSERVESSSFLIAAGAPAKVVNGTAAADRMVNTRDAELVDGGNGMDTFVNAGSRYNYTITNTSSGFKVTDKYALEGVDTLVNIERIQFVDINVALDINGTAGQAYRLYQAAFGRKPDLEGLGYWIKDMDKGSSLTTVAAGFFQSPEFQKLYGASPSINTLITNFYQNVLHRAPDQAGFDYWNEQLSKGQITAAGALASFCESTENQAQIIGSIQNGIDYKVWNG